MVSAPVVIGNAVARTTAFSGFVKSEARFTKLRWVMKQDAAVIKNPIRVFGVDELPLMRERIATIISAKPDMRLVAHASSAHEESSVFANICPM
jgi:hypothetical protein